MSNDSIYNEIKELKQDLESMNPNLSIYKTTLDKFNYLKSLVGEQGVQPSKKPNKRWRKGHRY